MTHEITKEEARKFLETKKYEFVNSVKVKLSNIGIDDADDDFYMPLNKEDFVKEYLEEELCVWQGSGESFLGTWDEDWEQILDDAISFSDEVEEDFKKYCKENDIEYDF